MEANPNGALATLLATDKQQRAREYLRASEFLVALSGMISTLQGW